MSDGSGRTALILGANGRFGLAAAQAFDAAGWRVLAQVRREAAAGMPPNAEVLGWSLDRPDELARAAAGATVLVHALNPPYTRWDKDVLPMARAAMDLAQRVGARFILPGNVYNFGAGMPPVLREDTPQRPTTNKGRIRVELERELQARCARGLAAIVLRAGDFFGGGSGSWFDLVIAKSIGAGKVVYPGPLEVMHAWAYLPDLARACVAVAAERGLPAFTPLHFPGIALTGRQMVDAIEAAATTMGLRPRAGYRQGTMPWALIRTGGLFVPMWREIAEMSYLWEVPHALDGSNLRNAVGDLPSTPLDEAVRAALMALPESARMPSLERPTGH